MKDNLLIINLSKEILNMKVVIFIKENLVMIKKMDMVKSGIKIF